MAFIYIRLGLSAVLPVPVLVPVPVPVPVCQFLCMCLYLCLCLCLCLYHTIPCHVPVHVPACLLPCLYLCYGCRLQSLVAVLGCKGLGYVYNWILSWDVYTRGQCRLREGRGGVVACQVGSEQRIHVSPCVQAWCVQAWCIDVLTLNRRAPCTVYSNTKCPAPHLWPAVY